MTIFLVMAAMIGSDQQPPAAPTAEPKVAEKKICKRVETTGRRTGGEKVCMTRSEWAKVEGRQNR